MAGVKVDLVWGVGSLYPFLEIFRSRKAIWQLAKIRRHIVKYFEKFIFVQRTIKNSFVLVEMQESMMIDPGLRVGREMERLFLQTTIW